MRVDYRWSTRRPTSDVALCHSDCARTECQWHRSKADGPTWWAMLADECREYLAPNPSAADAD